MTFDAIETSIDDAAPTEIFRFFYGDNEWTYANGVHSVIFQGRTYVPFPISRGGLKKSANIEAVQLDIVAAGNLPFAEIFRTQAPLDIIRVEVFQVFPAGEFSVVWKGRISSATWAGHEVTLTSDNIFSSLKRIGLRQLLQFQCPHTLYMPACGVLESVWEESLVVSAVSSTTVTIAAIAGRPSDYYAGGKISWVRDGVKESRLIRKSATGTGVLSVAGFVVGLSASQSVKLYPGCDHSLGANGCLKFSNVLNYGGFPYIPNAPNPFDAGNIW